MGTKTGWLPVIGGPRDGAEFYHPGEPRPGQKVNVGGEFVPERFGSDFKRLGYYVVGITGQSIVWVKT